MLHKKLREPVQSRRTLEVNPISTMENRVSSIFAFLLACSVARQCCAASLPNRQGLNNGRGASEATNANDPAIGYMQKLYREMADEDGLSLSENSPSIWCLTGEAMQSYETEEKCTTLTKYTFNLGPLTEAKQDSDPIRIQQGLLRLNMQVNPGMSPIKIEVVVLAKVLQDTRNDATSDSLLAGTHQVTATGGSNDWVEISVTGGLQTLFSSNAGASHLEITLQAKYDCKEQGTETVHLVNPLLVLFTDPGMDVPITKLGFGGIEKRHTRLQPSPPSSPSPHTEDDGSTESIKLCSRQPLEINFREDLGFNFILAPPSADIGYCNGVCPSVPEWPAKGVRKTLLRLLSPHVQLPTRERCCVPSGHWSLEVLLRINQTFVIGELPGLIVSTCHCV